MRLCVFFYSSSLVMWSKLRRASRCRPLKARPLPANCSASSSGSGVSVWLVVFFMGGFGRCVPHPNPSITAKPLKTIAHMRYKGHPTTTHPSTHTRTHAHPQSHANPPSPTPPRVNASCTNLHFECHSCVNAATAPKLFQALA